MSQCDPRDLCAILLASYLGLKADIKADYFGWKLNSIFHVNG